MESVLYLFLAHKLWDKSYLRYPRAYCHSSNEVPLLKIYLLFLIAAMTDSKKHAWAVARFDLCHHWWFSVLIPGYARQSFRQ